MYYVYILRCRDGTLYTGITPDLGRRMAAHVVGTGAKYTRSHPPEEIEALWRTAEKNDALRLEWAVKKRLTRAQKLSLIAAPQRLEELTGLETERFEHIPGVTLESLRGE
jgi:putative endonuclease